MVKVYTLIACSAFAYLLLLAIAIVYLGRRVAWIARPPAVDFVVALLTLVPWIVGWATGMRIWGHWIGGPAGLAATVVSQLAALELFDLVHAFFSAGPSLRINATLNRLYGSWRSRLGLWVTVPAIPGFLVIRLFQYLEYYPLVALLRFKKFRHCDYITVSRHKTQNLVGADLLWCLYCDWMTGLWSLGTEMLNQVESFWCPLAFADKDKCAKCAEFFEMNQWAPSDATPAQMKEAILTIRGNTPDESPVPRAPGPVDHHI